MKRMFNTVAALLTACALLAALSGCSAEMHSAETTLPMDTAASAPENAALQEAKAALLADWETFLSLSETVYSHMLWTLDYAQDYVRSDTWDDLLTARAACGAAQQALQQMSLPEQTLTEDQYLRLIDAGIEADVVLLEYENLSLLQSVNLEAVNLMEKTLTHDLFFTASAEAFPEWVENEQQFIAHNLEYLCITTNYLLLQLGEDTLWQQMPAKYPTIAAVQGQWRTDPAQLMGDCEAVLLQAEETELVLEAYVGVQRYTESIVEEAVRTGNLERLTAQMRQIPGVPAYFPLPDWIPVDTQQYCFVSEGHHQDLRLVTAGEDIPASPCACGMRCSSVPLADVEQYGQLLEAHGMKMDTQWDAQICRMTVTDGEAVMTVQWTAEETLLLLHDPVGCWIPALYWRAMD